MSANERPTWQLGSVQLHQGSTASLLIGAAAAVIGSVNSSGSSSLSLVALDSLLDKSTVSVHALDGDASGLLLVGNRTRLALTGDANASTTFSEAFLASSTVAQLGAPGLEHAPLTQLSLIHI